MATDPQKARRDAESQRHETGDRAAKGHVSENARTFGRKNPAADAIKRRTGAKDAERRRF